MKHTATRLSIFAMLSAAESDLRSNLTNLIQECLHGTDPYPAQMREKLLLRYKHTYGVNSQESTNTELLTFLDFGDAHDLLMRHASHLSTESANNLNTLSPMLMDLVGVRNRIMHTRPLESDDFSKTYDFATEACNQRGLAWTDLRSVMKKLEEDPSFVLTLKLPSTQWDSPKSIPHNLPEPQFDDTGYIGRTKDRKEVIRLLLGHHQIVTILGEGGVGKTALLVKCLYDIADSSPDRFDTIVWVSLKTQALTASGVETLRNAISSTLGLFQNISQPLGVPHSTSIEALFVDIREYLETFNVLLAIDNLETIESHALLEFLRDIPAKSKVVITSRIGLGELEFRRPLLSMNEQEATQLFRRLSQVHQVSSLAKLPHPDVLGMCRKLYCNPLIMRWYITSVQQGSSPDHLLTVGQRDILAFCVNNVYEKLSSDAQSVLDVLLAARRPIGIAELAYLV